MLTQDEWYKAVCESYSKPPVVIDGKELPGFPSDTIQANTTGQSGVNTLKDAFIFYQDCIDTFGNLGTPMGPQHYLLDFGVGWGRIARFFLRELPIENIYGIDVMEEFVHICVRTFRNDNFRVTAPFPPTQIPAEKFDFIVGNSVFSHLSEDASASWMKEFNRILAPGGILALTTRGRPFLDFCESLQGKGHTGYLGALSKIFDDFAYTRSRYEDDGLVGIVEDAGETVDALLEDSMAGSITRASEGRRAQQEEQRRRQAVQSASETSV